MKEVKSVVNEWWNNDIRREVMKKNAPSQTFLTDAAKADPGSLELFRGQVGMLPPLLRSLASFGCPALGDKQRLDRRKMTLLVFSSITLRHTDLPNGSTNGSADGLVSCS